jgi:Flp pilus assembly pilin Flp
MKTGSEPSRPDAIAPHGAARPRVCDQSGVRSKYGARSQISARAIAALRRDRAGAAAAEFALIVPLLLLILFGIIQMGLLIFTYGSMLNSARTGARQMAFGLTSEEQAVISSTALLPPWAAGAATITPTLDDAGLSRMAISVPGSTAAIIAFLPMPSTIDVNVAMPRAAAP